jgi:hypothetical protein
MRSADGTTPTSSVEQPVRPPETTSRTLRDMALVGSVQCPIIIGRDDLLDLADR